MALLDPVQPVIDLAGAAIAGVAGGLIGTPAGSALLSLSGAAVAEPFSVAIQSALVPLSAESPVNMAAATDLSCKLALVTNSQPNVVAFGAALLDPECAGGSAVAAKLVALPTAKVSFALAAATRHSTSGAAQTGIRGRGMALASPIAVGGPALRAQLTASASSSTAAIAVPHAAISLSTRNSAAPTARAGMTARVRLAGNARPSPLARTGIASALFRSGQVRVEVSPRSRCAFISARGRTAKMQGQRGLVRIARRSRVVLIASRPRSAKAGA